MRATITKINDLTSDLRIVYITPESPFLFKAGQYCMVSIDGLERPYSIACAPQENNVIELHVRNVGQMGQALCTNVKIGDTIEINGGFGTCTYKAQCKKPMLAIAGGTGLAPMKALVEKALSTNRENPIYLYHAGYGDNGVYFDTQLKAMTLIDSRLIYTPIISHNDPNTDTVKYGFVLDALKENHGDLKDCRAYVSGAPDMVKLVKKCLLNKNIDAGRLHYDNG